MFDQQIQGLRQRQRVPSYRLLLAVGLAFVLQTAHTEPALSLDEALLAAQQHSRQLLAQDAAAAAARERAIAAAQLPDPVIKGGLVNVPIDGDKRYSVTRDFMTMRSIGVMQEITREGKLKARSTRFERAADVAQAGRLAALARLQQETALAWLDRMHRDRLVEQLRTQRTEAALQIEAAEAVYRGGQGSQADIFAARSAVAQIDDGIEQALLDSGTARIRLMRWVGDAANRPLAEPPQRLTETTDRGEHRTAARAPSRHRVAITSNRSRPGRRRTGTRQHRVGLERRVDVQPAWPVVLEHGVADLRGAAAMGSD